MFPAGKRRSIWAAVLVLAGISAYEGLMSWRAGEAAAAAWRRAHEMEAKLAARRAWLIASRKGGKDLSALLAQLISESDERENLAALTAPDPTSRSVFRNPRLRDLRLKQLREQQASYWGPLLHKLHLSPVQEERFRQNLLEREQGLMDLQALVQAGKITEDERDSLMSNVGAALFKNMQAVLDPAQFNQWLVYQHSKFVSDWVENLALDSYGTATPLTADQADRFVAILGDPANHVPKPGEKAPYIHPENALWDRILPQAAAVLTPTQLADLGRIRQSSVAATELDTLTRELAARYGVH